jgi:hypothetical protein
MPAAYPVDAGAEVAAGSVLVGAEVASVAIARPAVEVELDRGRVGAEAGPRAVVGTTPLTTGAPALRGGLGVDDLRAKPARLGTGPLNTLVGSVARRVLLVSWPWARHCAQVRSSRLRVNGLASGDTW